MSLPGKARLAVACTLALAFGAVVAVAIASQTVHIDSKVTITKTSPVFAGKVKSSNPGCKDARKVKLHVVEQDNGVVGTDKTNHRGRWKIAFQGEGEAHYFASVRKRKEGAAGTIYVCEHDTSPPVMAP
jgi:hypothetical protein